MPEYITTRPFPAALAARIADLVPRHCRTNLEPLLAGATAEADNWEAKHGC